MEDRRVGERRCSLTHIRDAVNRTDRTRIEGRRGSCDFKSESANEPRRSSVFVASLRGLCR